MSDSTKKRAEMKSGYVTYTAGADLGGGCRGCAPPPPPEMTSGFLKQLVFCEKKTMWFIGVEVEQETSAPPPKKNPESASALGQWGRQATLLLAGCIEMRGCGVWGWGWGKEGVLLSTEI